MKQSKEKRYHTVVAGGGIAGLTCAAYLAKHGQSVLLIEKNRECGGLVNSFSRDGFQFEAGIRALENAGIGASDVSVIKTHNPFAANDIHLADNLGIDVNGMNNYGSSLIYGHPQGPTAGRLIIEGIEETAMKGGGYMLFAGCAAGDTAAALVLKVD